MLFYIYDTQLSYFITVSCLEITFLFLSLKENQIVLVATYSELIAFVCQKHSRAM